MPEPQRTPTTNPYESPAHHESTEAAIRSVRIYPLDISGAALRCRAIAADEIVREIRAATIDACRQHKVEVCEHDQVDAVIGGAILDVNEGSQLLRYLVPLLAGATRLRAVGRILCANKTEIPFECNIRHYAGVFGGSSEKMIRLSCRQLGSSIAAKVAVRNYPTASGSSFFLVASLVALVVGLLLAGIGCGLMMQEAGHQNDQVSIGVWGGVVFLLSSLGAFLWALVFAPTAAHYSPRLIWLQSISGLRSLIGLRILLSVFALIASGLVVLAYVLRNN